MVGPNALIANTEDFNELLALGYMEKDKINVSSSSPFQLPS